MFYQVRKQPPMDTAWTHGAFVVRFVSRILFFSRCDALLVFQLIITSAAFQKNKKKPV